MNDAIDPTAATHASGQTPYSAWMQTDILHTLQRRVSDHPGEHSWIVHVQVSELYWMLIIQEMQTAQACLRAGDLAQAQQALQRVVAHHAPLDAIWRSIAWMTPHDLFAILSQTVARHGKDTALQGWTYRQMVYLMGIKQAQHLQHFAPQPQRLEQLQRTLAEPSLYDDVIAYLHRAGFAIPSEVIDRDPALPYVPHTSVEQAWRDVYADPRKHQELQRLGETLADIAEGFMNWKFKHLMATRRTFGRRPAYFGSEGVAWLAPTLEEIPFPELWSSRTFIGEPPAAVGCPHLASQGR